LKKTALIWFTLSLLCLAAAMFLVVEGFSIRSLLILLSGLAAYVSFRRGMVLWKSKPKPKNGQETGAL
jgi:hypothetical protein